MGKALYILIFLLTDWVPDITYSAPKGEKGRHQSSVRRRTTPKTTSPQITTNGKCEDGLFVQLGLPFEGEMPAVPESPPIPKAPQQIPTHGFIPAQDTYKVSSDTDTALNIESKAQGELDSFVAVLNREKRVIRLHISSYEYGAPDSELPLVDLLIRTAHKFRGRFDTIEIKFSRGPVGPYAFEADKNYSLYEKNNRALLPFQVIARNAGLILKDQNHNASEKVLTLKYGVSNAEMAPKLPESLP